MIIFQKKNVRKYVIYFLPLSFLKDLFLGLNYNLNKQKITKILESGYTFVVGVCIFLKLRLRLLFFAGKSSNSPIYYTISRFTKTYLALVFFHFHFSDKIVLVSNCRDSCYVLFVIKFL